MWVKLPRRKKKEFFLHPEIMKMYTICKCLEEGKKVSNTLENIIRSCTLGTWKCYSFGLITYKRKISGANIHMPIIRIWKLTEGGKNFIKWFEVKHAKDAASAQKLLRERTERYKKLEKERRASMAKSRLPNLEEDVPSDALV